MISSFFNIFLPHFDLRMKFECEELKLKDSCLMISSIKLTKYCDIYPLDSSKLPELKK